MKTFRVGTFFDGGKPLISKIRAYTLWWSPEWKRCVVYDVEAENGTAAKRKARELRLAEEKAKAASAS